MIIMGTNHWEREMPKDLLVAQALKFADDVKAREIAELRSFLMAYDEKVLWCSWDTENPKALEAAFAEMNRQSGLVSELTPVEDMFPAEEAPKETVLR